MYKRVHYCGTILFMCSLIYLVRVVFTEIFDDESALVDEWLDQNDLSDFKKLFREYGISTLSGCGSPDQLDRLPELPASEEKRLRRAAQVLQQRLVLRQWLATHRLQHTYTKLLSLDVSSLEDVYWLEDSTARHVLDPKDFGAWSAARQSLPTGKEALQTLKADLWSAVVKNSKHQDAWTWETSSQIFENQNHIQPEDLIQEDETENNELLRLQTSSQMLPLNSTGNNSNESSVTSFQYLLPIIGNNSTEDAVTSQLLLTPISLTRIPNVAPPAVKESTTKKYNLNTLIAKTLQNHENRAKERATKICHHDEGDELQHFFNTMYAILKKMPVLSQHKLKRQIFNLLSDEEEYLLHRGPTSMPSPATPVPSPANPVPSPATPVPSPSKD